MDMDNMMNEMGGAFMVAWLVSDMGSLEGALVLAAAWMAISGAHILPVITWGHIMTGDLGDTDAWDGQWKPTGCPSRRRCSSTNDDRYIW